MQWINNLLLTMHLFNSNFFPNHLLKMLSQINRILTKSYKGSVVIYIGTSSKMTRVKLAMMLLRKDVLQSEYGPSKLALGAF